MADDSTSFDRQVTQANRARLLGIVQPAGGYRPHIDGLRALAVLAVAAYHYAGSYFPGGFIGVDIFFVISGYLITGILIRSNKAGTYSIVNFYQHRIRRIFPAAFVVLAFCFVVGWLTLFPSEYARLGQHIAAATGFVENLVLWRGQGYFSFGALQKPLLHFWSLAVEEQFYLVWPIMLWVAIRRHWPLLRTIAGIIAASFVLNVWMVASGHAPASFYLPVTRAWELMVGAALAVLHYRGYCVSARWCGWQGLLGLILIGVGLALINPASAFPGAWALLPVLGSALLLHAGPSAWINRYVLSWRPAVWVGLISYPLYLWHWALLSLAYVVLGPVAHGHYARAGTLAVISLLLAWGTYRWIERPVRQRGRRRTAAGLVGVTAVLGFAAVAVSFSGGAPARPWALFSPAAARYVASIRLPPRRNECHDLFKRSSWPSQWSCTLGDADAAQWVGVMGDSHAMAMIPALNAWGRSAHIRVVFASQDSCLSLMDTYRLSKGRYGGIDCMVQVRKMAVLAQHTHPRALIVIQRWPIDLHWRNASGAPQTAYWRHGALRKTGVYGKRALIHGLDTTLAWYAALRVPVVLVENNPRQGAKLASELAAVRFARRPSDAVFNANAEPLARHRHEEAGIDHVLATAAARYPSVTVINLDTALCGPHICPLVKGGRFLYHDDNAHLSVAGSMLVYPLLRKHMRQVLTR